MGVIVYAIMALMVAVTLDDGLKDCPMVEASRLEIIVAGVLWPLTFPPLALSTEGVCSFNPESWSLPW